MRVRVPLLLGVSLVGCSGSTPGNARYIASAAPLHFLENRYLLCVAIDPTGARGVRWWEPGHSGCSHRSTGPGVFPAERAKVTKTFDAIDVHFEMPLHSGASLPVKLTIVGDSLRFEPSGERVSIERLRDLDAPPANVGVP